MKIELKQGDLVRTTKVFNDMGPAEWHIQTGRITMIVIHKLWSGKKRIYARVKIIYPRSRKDEVMKVGLLWLAPVITTDWAEYMREWRKKNA